MMNIEMHGFEKRGSHDVIHKIASIIKSELPSSLLSEIVIDYIPSECDNVKTIIFVCEICDKAQPFLRVYSDNKEKLEQVAPVLQIGGFEVETVLIHKFYPKR